MPDPRTENDRYILKLWTAAALPAGLSVVGFVVVLASGKTRFLSVAMVALTISILGASLLVQLSKVRRALLRPGPEMLIEFLLANEKRLPAFRAQFRASAALGAALFERPELAEEHLATVKWENEVPFNRAAAEVSRALVHYCRGEWTEGFARARNAGALSDVDGRAPGAGTSRLAFDTHVALGAALVDRTNSTTRPTLETAFEKLPLIGQLIAAWGLHVLARREGRATDAETAAAFIRDRAPHAALLARVPEDVE